MKHNLLSVDLIQEKLDREVSHLSFSSAVVDNFILGICSKFSKKDMVILFNFQRRGSQRISAGLYHCEMLSLRISH